MSEWIPITQDTPILCGIYAVVANGEMYMAHWNGTWRRQVSGWPPSQWPELRGVTHWLYEEKAYG